MLASVSGIIASRNKDKVPVIGAEYFTSTLYPITIDDVLVVGLPDFSGSQSLWEIPNDMLALGPPDVVAGTLTATIVYVLYSDLPTDRLQTSVPEILSGTLTPTIAYVLYSDLPTDRLQTGVPEILSGTITTTIAYISYDNWPSDSFQVGVPSIESGTLT